MRPLILAFMLASVALAQGPLNPIGATGNVLHPGIPASGPPPGSPRVGALSPSQIPRAGGFQRGSGSGRNGHQRGNTSVIVPYPVGGESYYGGNGFYQPAPGVYDPIWGIYNPGPADPGYQSQPPQQSPTVVINQNFQADTAHPVLRDYSNVQLPEPTFKQVVPAPNASPTPAAAGNDQATIYLIALKDHTIYPVLGYWVDKGVLNYVTLGGTINRASLDLVDREFSQHLNDERHVEFALPSGK